MRDIDRQRDLDWLHSFSELYAQAAQLAQEFRKSPTSEEERVAGLKELQDKFTIIRKSVQDMPRPKQSELRKIKKDFELVCRGYSDACKAAIEWAKRPTTFIETSTILIYESAEKDMEKVKQRLSLLSRK